MRVRVREEVAMNALPHAQLLGTQQHAAVPKPWRPQARESTNSYMCMACPHSTSVPAHRPTWVIQQRSSRYPAASTSSARSTTAMCFCMACSFAIQRMRTLGRRKDPAAASKQTRGRPTVTDHDTDDFAEHAAGWVLQISGRRIGTQAGICCSNCPSAYSPEAASRASYRAALACSSRSKGSSAPRLLPVRCPGTPLLLLLQLVPMLPRIPAPIAAKASS